MSGSDDGVGGQLVVLEFLECRGRRGAHRPTSGDRQSDLTLVAGQTEYHWIGEGMRDHVRASRDCHMTS